jgi:hypothetical protein
MEVARSSETSVYNKPTRRHIPEGGILPNNLSYLAIKCVTDVKFRYKHAFQNLLL